MKGKTHFLLRILRGLHGQKIHFNFPEGTTRQKKMILLIQCEYGDGGTIRIAELRDEAGTDYTFLAGHDDRFLSFTDIREHIAGRLQVAPGEIELEEI